MALADNLISYYKLDETTGTTADDAHSTNDGTYNGDLPTAVAGILVNAQSPDGTGDDATLTTLVGYGNSDEETVNFWMKTASTADFAIMGTTNAGSPPYHQIKSEFGTADGRFLCTIATSTGGTKILSGRFTEAGVNDGGWHMVTITWKKSTNVMTGYVDAVSKSITYITQSTPVSQDLATSLRLFSEDGNELAPSGFILDEVGFWARALTSTEVTTLYNSGAALSYESIFQVNITITPATLTLSTTATAPSVHIIISPATLQLSLNFLSGDFKTVSAPSTISVGGFVGAGEKEIRRDWPHTEGTTFGTTKQEGTELALVPTETDLIEPKTRRLFL